MALPVWLSVRLFNKVSLEAKYKDCAEDPPKVRLLDDEPPKKPEERVTEPLAISVLEPITKVPLVRASVLIIVVVPPRFRLPPFSVSALNVAFPPI